MVQEESLLVRPEIAKVQGSSRRGKRGAMWDLNNRFLVMMPDLCHPFLRGGGGGDNAPSRDYGSFYGSGE